MRIRHFSADSMSLRIDTCSIIPNTFQIQELQRSQYRLDPLTATFYLLDSSLLGKRIFVQYEVYPTDLSLPVAHKFSRDIEQRHYRHQTADYPLPSLKNVLNDNELYTNGAISRGVTVGTNQDLVLNSALNLQITGKLSDDVEIMASVSDKNIPIQPEGNTQTLQDISSVFIALKIKEIAGFLLPAVCIGDANLATYEPNFSKYFFIAVKNASKKEKATFRMVMLYKPLRYSVKGTVG